MKFVKRVLAGIAVLIVLLLIVALFSAKEYTIGREVTINKPVHEVFDYIRMLKHQDYYNKWVMADPAMKKEFKGTDGTQGFIYAWDGNGNVGKGEQEITRIVTDERVDMELRFIRPFESKADCYMTTTAAGTNQTLVRWGFHSRMKYPLNIMLLFINMDKMMGKDLDTSLGQLKRNLEK